MEATGLALAILPLGVKLYNEIRNYLDGLECADHEISTAAAHLECLASSLDLIEEAIQAVGPIEERVQAAAKRHVGLVRVQLEQLEKLVDELTQGRTNSDASVSTQNEDTSDVVSSVSWRSRWKQKRKKLAYPFQRESLRRLEDGLASLNSSLAVSLQGLEYRRNQARDAAQIEATTKVLTALSGIQSSIPDAHNIAEAMLRLTTKPQAIAAAGDALGVTGVDVARATQRILGSRSVTRPHFQHMAPICTCYTNRRTKESSWTIGPLSLASTSSIRSFHEPSCRMVQFQRSKTSSMYKASLRTHYRRSMASLISLAIHFSYGGNNQWSRACELQTFNLRDINKSPVTSLVNLGLLKVSLSQGSLQAISDYWRYSLLGLFEDGKASPNDVDLRNGDTSLHILASRYYEYRRAEHRQHSDDLGRTMLRTLHEVRVPYQLQNKGGLTAGNAYLQGLSFVTTQPGSLISEHSGLPSFQDWYTNLESSTTGFDLHMPDFWKSNLQTCLRIAFVMAKVLSENPDTLDGTLRSTIKFTQIGSGPTANGGIDSNIGPLGRAIILRSYERGKERLEQDREAWAEKFPDAGSNICALHLALLWFPSLTHDLSQTTVELHSAILWDETKSWADGSYRSLLGIVMLGLALYTKYDAPEHRDWGDLGVQDYIRSILWLLKQDCPIYWTGNFVQDLNDAVRYRSPRDLGLLDVMIAHLADRRKRLRDFAVSRLACEQVFSLGLHNATLVDGNTMEVLYALHRQGIQIPTAIQPLALGSASWHRSTSWASNMRSLGTPVFHITGVSPQLADKLLQAGFAQHGVLRALYGNMWGYHLLWKDTWFHHWALCHDTLASISDLMGPFVPHQSKGPFEYQLETPGWTLFHGFMAVLGVELFLHDPILVEKITGMFAQNADQLATFLRSGRRDACDCGCSRSGCLPLTSFLHGIWWNYGIGWDDQHEANYSLATSASFLDSLYTESGIPLALVEEYLRFWTFSHFECRHTCCKQGLPNSRSMFSHEEFFDNDDEDERMELRREDAAKLVVVEKVTADSLRAFGSEHSTLHHFMNTHWKSTVQAASRALDATEAARVHDPEKVRDLGVVLKDDEDLVNSDDDRDSNVKPLIDDGFLSDVSSIDMENSTPSEREEWELKHVQTVKRAIDRICGRSCPENGKTTGRVNGMLCRRHSRHGIST